MIITYLRSSSFTTHTMCPQRYFIEYVLGVKPPSNKAADKGNVVHKALEVLAHQSKCRRLGLAEYEDETFGKMLVEEITPKAALDLAYGYYTRIASHHTWYSADYRDCTVWMNSALESNGGRFDPRNRYVIEAEQRFDFIIDEPWSHYSYQLPDGTVIEGQLGIKGTMDLVTKDDHDDGIIEIIDWKTGWRKDWGKDTDEKKTYTDFRTDPQLCLYHYASTLLFPEAEAIFITIFWAKDGGPFTLCFDQSDVEYTKQIIRAKFEEIKETQRPVLNIGKQCYTFCHFGKRNSGPGGKSLCQHYAEQVVKLGADAVTHKFGKPNAFREYGDGGGRRGDV